MEESQEINKKLAEGGLGAELGESKRHVKRLMKEMGNPQRNLDEEAAKYDKDELQDEIDRQEKELEDMTKMLDDKDRSSQGDIHNIGKKAGVLSIKLIEEQRSSVILSERYQHSVEKCVNLTEELKVLQNKSKNERDNFQSERTEWKTHANQMKSKHKNDINEIKAKLDQVHHKFKVEVTSSIVLAEKYDDMVEEVVNLKEQLKSVKILRKEEVELRDSKISTLEKKINEGFDQSMAKKQEHEEISELKMKKVISLQEENKTVEIMMKERE